VRVASLMNILLRLQASSSIESSLLIALSQLRFPHSTFFFIAFGQGGKQADYTKECQYSKLVSPRAHELRGLYVASRLTFGKYPPMRWSGKNSKECLALRKKPTTVNALRLASDRILVATSIVFDGEMYREMEREREMQSSTVLAVRSGWVVVEPSRVD
jgi:hypothetical protein